VIYGSVHHRVGLCCDVLAKILDSQGKLGDESRELHQRFLDISILNDGVDGLNTAIANVNIARHYQIVAKTKTTENSIRTQFMLSKSHFEEGVKIYSQRFGPTHECTLNALFQLTNVLQQL
jgi:hypothetical protein